MKKLGIVFGIFLAIIIGGYVFLNNQIESIKQEAQVQDDITDTALGVDLDSPLPGEEIEYSMEEVTMHSSKDDCWLLIENNIYDVTGFIKEKKHPGGDAILQGCGKDATELFETRPMGSKTPHSEGARESLAAFQIGVLSNDSQQ